MSVLRDEHGKIDLTKKPFVSLKKKPKPTISSNCKIDFTKKGE